MKFVYIVFNVLFILNSISCIYLMDVKNASNPKIDIKEKFCYIIKNETHSSEMVNDQRVFFTMMFMNNFVQNKIDKEIYYFLESRYSLIGDLFDGSICDRRFIITVTRYPVERTGFYNLAKYTHYSYMLSFGLISSVDKLRHKIQIKVINYSKSKSEKKLTILVDYIGSYGAISGASSFFLNPLIGDVEGLVRTKLEKFFEEIESYDYANE